MSKEITIVTPADVTLEARTVPVLPGWVLSGDPLTRSSQVLRSHDWTSNIVIWECTPGRFRWNYNKDEVVIIVSGEVFITDQTGEERRLGPGDLGFFPAGSSCTWRVTEHVRKIAVLRETMWRPLGLGLKVWKKLLRTAGIGGESPL